MRFSSRDKRRMLSPLLAGEERSHPPLLTLCLGKSAFCSKGGRLTYPVSALGLTGLSHSGDLPGCPCKHKESVMFVLIPLGIVGILVVYNLVLIAFSPERNDRLEEVLNYEI